MPRWSPAALSAFAHPAPLEVRSGQVRSGLGHHDRNLFACATHLHGFPLSRDLAFPPTRILLRTRIHIYIHTFLQNNCNNDANARTHLQGLQLGLESSGCRCGRGDGLLAIGLFLRDTADNNATDFNTLLSSLPTFSNWATWASHVASMAVRMAWFRSLACASEMDSGDEAVKPSGSGRCCAGRRAAAYRPGTAPRDDAGRLDLFGRLAGYQGGGRMRGPDGHDRHGHRRDGLLVGLLRSLRENCSSIAITVTRQLLGGLDREGHVLETTVAVSTEALIAICSHICLPARRCSSGSPC